MSRIAARSIPLLCLGLAFVQPLFAQGPPKSSDDAIPTLQTDPLPEGAVHRIGTTRLRLPMPAGYFIFNPDDSVLMVGCGGDVRFWETKTWRELWRLEALAFSCSPDGKHVARMTHDRNVEIWDAHKKVRVHSVNLSRIGRHVRIFDIEFNHKGDGLWLGVSGQGIWLYNWNKGDIAHRIAANDFLDSSLCLSRDRKTLAMRRHSERIAVYDAVTFATKREITTPRSADEITLNHDGKILASHDMQGQTKFWDTTTGKSVSLLPDPPKKPGDERDDNIAIDGMSQLSGRLLFDAKGDRIVFTGRLAAFDPKAKSRVAQAERVGQGAYTGAIGNTNTLIAVGSSDGSVDVRRLDSLKPTVNDPFPRGAALSLAFSHDGRSLATYHASEAGEVRTWSVGDFGLGKRFSLDHGGENDLSQAFRVAASGRFATESLARSMSNAVRLRFLPDNQKLALGSNNLWNLESGNRIPTKAIEQRLVRATSDNRRWLIAKENDIFDVTELSLYDSRTKQTIATLPLEISPENCYPSDSLFGVLSADGGIIALQARPASQRDPNTGESPRREASLIVWNARGEQPKKLFATTFDVTPRSFDLDASGRFLVVQGGPSVAAPHRLWHVPTGLPLWKIETHDDPSARKKPTLPIATDFDLSGDIDFDVEDLDLGDHVAFAPDGQVFAEAGFGKIVIRETLSGQRLLSFPSGDGAVCDLAFSPDGRLLASASRDSTVTLWKIPPFAAAAKGTWTHDSFEERWKILSGPALPAYQALADLHAGGDEAVARIAAKIRPEIRDEHEKIRAAMADLASPKFHVREKATVRLEQWGYRLKPYLQEAISQATDLEQQRRLGALLDRYKSAGIDPNELRLGRCVFLLEQIGTAAARQLLDEIALGNSHDMTVESARAALARFEMKRAKADRN